MTYSGRQCQISLIRLAHCAIMNMLAVVQLSVDESTRWAVERWMQRSNEYSGIVSCDFVAGQ